MAIELERLIKKIKHTDITCLAGKNSMDNLVGWVHMAEAVETTSFLDAGDIAIITGIGIDSDENKLLELTRKIYEQQGSAIIVNTGPFIEKVPQNMIDYCNEHSLPLFCVPWKVHLAEIMRMFCFCLTKEEQKVLESASAFKNAISFPDEEELYVVPLSRRNFEAEWSYAVCVMNLKGDSYGEDMSLRLERFSHLLDSYARHKRYSNFSIFPEKGKLLIIAGNYTQERLDEFVYDLYKHAQSIVSSDESIYIGLGRLTKSIRCLYKSYDMALAIEKLQEKGSLGKNLYNYPSLGMYQLLIGIENREIMTSFSLQKLGRIKEYDAAHGSSLYPMLNCYLQHNGSVKDTADTLYVQRNTVNYNLAKISDLLQVDLSSLEVRCELMLAFKIDEML